MSTQSSNVETLHGEIVAKYGGGDFDEILEAELHRGSETGYVSGLSGSGLTFKQLARKWGIGVNTLGWLIYDHCIRMWEDENETL